MNRRVILPAVSAVLLLLVALSIMLPVAAPTVNVVGREATFVFVPPNVTPSVDLTHAMLNCADIAFTAGNYFASGVHNDSSVSTGYGFLTETPVKGNMQDWHVSNADLTLPCASKRLYGLYGITNHTVPGFAVEIGRPRLGTAIILASMNIGAEPETLRGQIVATGLSTDIEVSASNTFIIKMASDTEAAKIPAGAPVLQGKRFVGVVNWNNFGKPFVAAASARAVYDEMMQAEKGVN